MKKELLFTLLCIVSVIFPLKAAHLAGGTIGWECSGNGQYRFTMEVYTDCGGDFPFSFVNDSLSIRGNPLPEDIDGHPISSITLRPDSNRWLNANRGDLSPQCSSGASLDCDNGDPTVRVFWYVSDPITLNGVPPRNGWTFIWQAPCCRSTSIANLNSFGIETQALFAQMFPFNNQNANPCYDSSPTFKGDRTSFICREYVYTYNQIAEDEDFDSLVYSKENAFNIENNGILTPALFIPPFTLEDPTPTTNLNSNNIGYSLDSRTGSTRLAVFNGRGTELYTTGVRVDAYREGQRISSTHRERDLVVLDCPPLASGQANNPPMSMVLNNTLDTNQIELDVVAGELVEFPIELVDDDFTGAGLEQNIRVVPRGNLFTLSKGPNTNSIAQTPRQRGFPCTLPGTAPCAYLENMNPTLDFSQVITEPSISGLGSIQTVFVWQTDCNHLKADGSVRSYDFYLNSSDDHCPVPYVRSIAIRINVHPINTTSQPKLDCVVQRSNGKEINWSASIGQTNGFQSVEIYKSNSNSQNFMRIQTITDSAQTTYLDRVDPMEMASYYIQVIEQNCAGSTSASQPSDTLSVTPLILQVNNTAECFQLDWNQETTLGLTQYIIYREFPLGSGLTEIASLFNDSSYCDLLVNCGDSVRYQVVRENDNANCNETSNTVTLSGGNSTVNDGIQIVNRTFVATETDANYLWFSCSRNITFTDSTNRTFSPQDTGTYGVIVTKFGCRDTSMCLSLLTVGLTGEDFQQSVSLFPNPTNGLLYLEGLTTGENYQLTIRNLQGQLVKEQSISGQNTIKLTMPGETGIYFFQLVNSVGERANFKLIKQ